MRACCRLCYRCTGILLKGRSFGNIYSNAGRNVRTTGLMERGSSTEIAETSDGAGDGFGVSLQKQVSIPFELVDDDEMAAIEMALLHASSLSSTYHSLERALVLGSATCGRSQSEPRHPTSLSKKFKSSFVYTVASDSLCTTRSIDEGLIAAAHESIPSSVLDVACCSQSSQHEMESLFNEVHTHEFLSVNSQLRATTECEESSTSLVVSKEVPRMSNSIATSPFPGDTMSGITSNSMNLKDIEEVDQGSGLSQDMEDILRVKSTGSFPEVSSIERRVSGPGPVTLFHRKSGRGLSVTDFTASEWCEMQVDFSLNRGKPEQTVAMKAGSVRHAELEKEVVTRVEIEIHTKEDSWALRLLNFVTGARQLFSEGITRELPVLGILGGSWVVGFIDEIRLVVTESGEKPLIVDTKTRKRRVPPSEPQKRNARLQLMCYKVLWDNMIETGVPSESFFKHFGLNPQQRLCQDIKSHANTLWVNSNIKCLQDLMLQIMEDVRSQIYQRSLDTLLLRYEWQEDHSLLGEDEFHYEHEWLMDRWKWHSEFWSGDRAPSLVPGGEAWKCRYCSFSEVCLQYQQVAGLEISGPEKPDKRL